MLSVMDFVSKKRPVFRYRYALQVAKLWIASVNGMYVMYVKKNGQCHVCGPVDPRLETDDAEAGRSLKVSRPRLRPGGSMLKLKPFLDMDQLLRPLVELQSTAVTYHDVKATSSPRKIMKLV